MINVLKDNSLIYELLEKSGALFTDFSGDKVVAFDHEDNFHIVIYSSSSRNFILFTAKDYLQHVNSFPELINAIQECAVPSIHSSLIEQAIKLTENKMHSKNNSRFFFDAH
ncbi:MAG: hypothetical protein ACXVDZ_17485 [Bacteroidia bacterium]